MNAVVRETPCGRHVIEDQGLLTYALINDVLDPSHVIPVLKDKQLAALPIVSEDVILMHDMVHRGFEQKVVRANRPVQVGGREKPFVPPKKMKRKARKKLLRKRKKQQRKRDKAEAKRLKREVFVARSEARYWADMLLGATDELRARECFKYVRAYTIKANALVAKRKSLKKKGK